MLGILLALALSQQPSQKCTVVNFTATDILLVCGKNEGYITTADWPTEQWGRAMIGESYPITADGFPISLTTKQRQEQRNEDEFLRQRSLAEQRRWRIQPAQVRH